MMTTAANRCRNTHLLRALGLLPILLLLGACSGHAPVGRDIDYDVGQARYEGYFVSPGAGAPLVVLVHDWDGLTGYERRRARMLVAEGYAVFAVDLFGKGVRPAEIAERRKLTGALYADRAEMRRRLTGALDAARAAGADLSRAVAVGYCFGGTAVLELARSGAPLRGFASFHGGLATPDG